MSRIILLTGKAGSGKTTAAEYLEDKYQYRRMKFADPLKDMLRVLGLDNRHLEGDLKEVPNNLLCAGHTPRYLMQTLGTEWGRNCIHTDFWAATARNKIRDLDKDSKAKYVFDDARFQNEIDVMQETFGYDALVVNLERPHQVTEGVTSQHASELQELDWDVKVENFGDLETFYNQIDGVFT